MTGSKHEYTLTLLSDPEIELQLDDDSPGNVRLDAATAPHISGTVKVKPQSMEILAALDPRETPRVRLDVHATFPTSTTDRSFDVGIRDLERVQIEATTSLPIASDEALLTDYAPLADDVSMFAMQGSLVDIVNHVLDEAIPGAALEVGTADEDLSVYATATNLITDPNGDGGGAIYTARNSTVDKADMSWSGGRAFNLYSPTGTDSNLSIGPQTTGVRAFGVTPGRTYLFSAEGRVKPSFPLSGTPNARALELTVSDEYGVIAHSAKLSTTPGVASRLSVVVTLPERGTFYFRAWHGYPGGGQVQWRKFRLSEYTGDPTDIGPLDGGLTDTAAYEYTWEGTADDSTSKRLALIDRDPESIIWPAGVDALRFLQPLVQAFGRRLVCDEQRKWTLRNEGFRAPGALAVRHGVNMIEGRERISRDAGLWFDARVTRYHWTDRNGTQQIRTDAYALTDPYTRLTTLDIDAAYPGPGRSEYAVRRAQGRGREVTVTKVSDWNAHAEQPISVVLDGSATQVGITQSVEFDLSTDRMTIATRTTDMPVGAVDLLAGTVDDLVGTVHSL